MKNLTIPVYIGFLFSAIGLASLFLSGQVLTATIWLSFGNGLVLSGLRFNQLNEQGQEVVVPVPKARVYTGIFLILLAVVLLVIQILTDLQSGVAVPAE